MKTVCVIDSISRANGGIFEAERKLQQGLSLQPDLAVEVLGLRDAHTDADLPAWSPLRPHALPVMGPSGFGYAPGFTSTLSEINADLAYSVGLWKNPSLAVLRWSRTTGKPYVVAPHGMLDPWAIRNSAAKKKIAGLLFQNAHLRRAACLRALCASEAESMRAYGLTNPIAIIPNGVDLPDVQHAAQRPASFPADKKILLYLGRLHPKKGLVPLLTAWGEVGNARKDWVLVIAGWDQSGHMAELQQQAAAFSDSVRFIGPQFGADKDACFRACDAFILPSFSEGLPMVVLEAWAHAKPVLMTPACNLPEGFAQRAALRIEPNSQSILTGLRDLFDLSSFELQTMGEQGRTLVLKRFTWPQIADNMVSVYRWVIGVGAQPSCVDGS